MGNGKWEMAEYGGMAHGRMGHGAQGAEGRRFRPLLGDRGRGGAVYHGAPARRLRRRIAAAAIHGVRARPPRAVRRRSRSAAGCCAGRPSAERCAAGGGATGDGSGSARCFPLPFQRVAPYWTDFRGPLRDGHYREHPILTDWPSSGLKPLWKHPIGGGYASFVIARGRAFTIEQRGEEEVAAAYDVGTGRELWTNRWAAAFREMMGGDGPRATPTWRTAASTCSEQPASSAAWTTRADA